MPPSRWNEPGPKITAHSGLLTALSPVKRRTNWWEYRDNGQVALCLLCGSIQAQRLTWGTDGLEEHERRHVEALGVEKVAAAEMLYRLRLEEAETKLTGFTQRIRKEYYLGNPVPTLLTEGALVPEFNMPKPIWRSIIEEVWGCVPSVALPDHNNRQGPRP